ncbi:MAG: hypothetical protein U9R28_09875 [Pseudomonadota bacterium]|nr:hypothetical protein [Pseudomonadota bacterium]
MSNLLGSLHWAVFVLVSIGFLTGLFTKNKINLHREWLNHFQISLFPSITLTALLVVVTLVYTLALPELTVNALMVVYFLIVAIHTLLNIYLINRWIFSPSVPIEHHKPTWFILLSGNFVVVISGLTLIEPFAIQHWLIWPELLWLYFSGGLLLWFSFTVSLFYRLIFDSNIEIALRPSLFIFLAPPSLATVASILLLKPELILQPELQVAVPALTWFLFSFASFMLIIWFLSIRYFIDSGLSVASWAYVYPLAAYGMAMQYIAQANNSELLMSLSMGIFLIVLFLIALLSIHSLLDSIKS